MLSSWVFSKEKKFENLFLWEKIPNFTFAEEKNFDFIFAKKYSRFYFHSESPDF